MFWGKPGLFTFSYKYRVGEHYIPVGLLFRKSKNAILRTFDTLLRIIAQVALS